MENSMTECVGLRQKDAPKMKNPLRGLFHASPYGLSTCGVPEIPDNCLYLSPFNIQLLQNLQQLFRLKTDK
jgi:hypothetical protein